MYSWCSFTYLKVVNWNWKHFYCRDLIERPLIVLKLLKRIEMALVKHLASFDLQKKRSDSRQRMGSKLLIGSCFSKEHTQSFLPPSSLLNNDVLQLFIQCY